MAVRRESVVLELETNFPTEAAKSAAAIALLNEEIKKLGDASAKSRTANRDLGREIDKNGASASKASSSHSSLSASSRTCRRIR